MKTLNYKTLQLFQRYIKEVTLVLLLLISFSAEAGNSWSSKKNFGGGDRRNAIGFMIGNKAYIGTGLADGNPTMGIGATKDFWAWDPNTNSWTQKADFGGGERAYAVGFSIGNKGYVGTGENDNGNQNDFWEYDTSSNKWTQKTKYPGSTVEHAVGFSIGNKGYVGTGKLSTGYSTSSQKKDFYEYDPSSDSWSQKADFGGTVRSDAVGFCIGNKGYIGTGISGSNLVKDFWQYDTSSDTWKQKTDFPGLSRYDAVGFSIGSKGYLGIGTHGAAYDLSDFYEYDPNADTWTKKTSYGNSEYGAVAFSNCTNGFIGTGTNYYLGNSGYSDFMEYTPSVTPEAIISASKTELCPGGSVNFADSSTNSPVSWKWTFQGGSPASSTSQNPSNIVYKNPGTYTVTLVSSNQICSSTATQIITVDSLPTISISPTSPKVCAGSSVSISVTGASKYSWSPGTGLSSTKDSIVTANPSSSTNYTVTGTSSVGCVNTANISITVNPKPTVTVNPSSKTICSGDVVPLSANGASTYSWSPSTGLSSTKGASVNATPSNTITYTVSGTDANGCTNTASVPITVNALPNADAGHDVTICGGSTNLLATGGTSYSWSPATGLSCTNCPNPVASPSATTKYTVTVTGANGCSKNAFVTVNITTKITANAGSDSTICNGKSTMLNASGGTGYSWHPVTGLNNPNIANPVASPVTTTTYTVKVTSGTCTPDSDNVTITVNPLPPIPTITANGTTLKSSASSGNQWYMDGNIIAGATSQFYTITQNGFYSVCVTNPNGCSSCSQDTSSTAINESLLDRNIDVFPNPTSGKFSLNTSIYQQKTEMVIFNILSKMVYTGTLYGPRIEIDLSSQPKGAYFLELRNESGIYTKKVVIE